MLRVRRFVLLAVLTLSGGIALTACQSAPGLAAQVGGVRLTDERVEEIVEQIDNTLLSQDQERIDSAGTPPAGETVAAPRGLPSGVFGDVRQDIVEFTVFNELARVYVQEKGLTWTPPDYAQASQQVGLAPQRAPDGTTVFKPSVVLYADTVSYHQLLSSSAQRAEPTEADLRDAYNRALAAGAIDPAISFEQVRGELRQLDQMQTGVWLRNELAGVAERIGVTVNPRYRPLEIATGSLAQQSGQVILVALPLGEQNGTPAVREAG
jgi:hypothetical protein